MFGLGKKNETTKAVETVEQAVLLADDNRPIGEIYTMPSLVHDYTPSGSVMDKKPKSSSKVWIWVMMGSLVVAALGTAGYFLWQNSKNNQPTNNQPLVNNPPVAQQPQEPTPPQTTAKERDQQRYFDIGKIGLALDLYYKNKGTYPISTSGTNLGLTGAETLSAADFSKFPQQPVYLDPVPKDPGDTNNYIYSSTAGLTYKITFILEEGIAGLLSAGLHFYTPAGFDKEEGLEITPDDTTKIRTTPPPLSLDSDDDGLTDIEELIYGTDINNPDTDGDSYPDGTEVINAYDPAHGEGKKLFDSAAVTKYTSSNGDYTIYYPISWQLVPGQEPEEIRFVSATDEFVQISFPEHDVITNVVEWYAKMTNLRLEEVSTTKIGNKTTAVSPDGLNLYLSLSGRLVNISYNIGTHKTQDYASTFKMMYRVFSPLLTPTDSE